jgi:hypothetical protein
MVGAEAESRVCGKGGAAAVMVVGWIGWMRLVVFDCGGLKLFVLVCDVLTGLCCGVG